MPIASWVRQGALCLVLGAWGCAAEQTWVARPAGAQRDEAPALDRVALREALPGLKPKLLPARHDLSLRFPPPGDMGPANEGVAWAAGYGLLTYLETRGADLLPRAGRETYPERWFDPRELQGRLAANAQGAVSPLAALGRLVEQGAARWDAPPGAARGRLTGIERADPRDVPGLKGHLREGTPLLVTIPQDEALLGLHGDAVWRGPAGPAAAWQTLVLCGYDDAREAFFALAAWGPDWGDRGFAWLGYEAVARHATSALIGLDRPEVDLGGSWRAHEQVVLEGRGEWIHDAQDVALELSQVGAEWEGSLTLTRTWLRVGRDDAVRAALSERRSYRLAGPAGARVLRLTATPTDVALRARRGDLAGPIVHAARRDERGLALAGPLVRGARVAWRPGLDDDLKRVLAPLASGLERAAAASRPRPWAPAPLALSARATVYAGGLVLLLDDPDGEDRLLELRRPRAAPGAPHLVAVAGARDRFWRDGGRAGALRRLRSRAPGAVEEPAALPALPPGGEGLPVFEAVELVRTEGRLWLLDAGLRRPAADAVARARGFDVEAASELAPGDLTTYPVGPPLE